MQIHDAPSPNQNARPKGAKISLVVIHGTVGTDTGDLEWCRSPKSQISYHYLVQRTGAIYRLVRPERRAWHAGKSVWEGVEDVNDFSIGIGLSNLGNGEPYTEAQYKAAGWLLSIFRREYRIGMEDVIGHYHISPGRKTDPFFIFEWGRLFHRMHELAEP